MQPTTPTATPGEMLAGKYRVEGVLGEGGMGVVLAATNAALRQPVAIKLLRSGALDNAEALGRFHREAQAAARLKSEHVARVLDVSTLPDGRPYMVMERLEGLDLGEVVEKRSPLPIEDAIEFVLQACEAIAEAHAAGIIHRDLKPKNLFLTTTVDGRPLVKVLDFGISKITDQSADMQLTRTTEIIGSPSYMSPEQLRSSRNVDTRTDIWALGVILYELLTGRLPFYAQTVTELVLVVATDPERPAHALRPDVPPALSHVIARCLAKRPEERIQSVVELAAHLEPFAPRVMNASSADRVRGVAAQSGKALPPTPPSSANAVSTGPQSSARIHVAHAGTSVAWGQTQKEASVHPLPPPVRASGPRAPTAAIVAILGAAGLVLAGAVGGAIHWMKGARAAGETNAPPAAASESLPLPPGRKDLPPLDPPAPPTSSAQSAPAPSALPSTRTAPPPKPAHTGTRPKTAPAPAPDDLSNIGRR